MHKDVAVRSDKKRRSAVDSHNRKTNIRPINFTEGGFVLRGILRNEQSRKPSLKWLGPYRVVECRSDFIFIIEDLLTAQKKEVPGRRLKIFRNKDYHVTEKILEHLKYQTGELLTVESFTDIRQKQGIVELHVKWGFADKSDWVNISSLREDVPELFKEFLEELQKTGTKRQSSVASTL